MSLVKTATVIIGLTMYSRYSNCDPFTTKQISRNDQLLPYFVLDVAGKIPGLPGLFIAGVFSAALSTLSAHLNCVSGTIFEDFIAKCLHRDIKEKTKSNILKLIVVVFGVICTALVYITEHLGGVLPLSVSVSSVTAGPLLGMFTLGVLFRRANSNGAFYGGIISVISVFSLNMMIQYYKAQGLFRTPTNETQETVPFIVRISFYYHTLIGTVLALVAGLIISYSTQPDEKIIDENLLCPLIQKPPKKVLNGQRGPVEYNTVETALNLVVHNIEKNNIQMDKM